MANHSSPPQARNNPQSGCMTRRQAKSKSPLRVTRFSRLCHRTARRSIACGGLRARTQTSPKIMRINEDGSGQVAVSDLDIMQLQSVSPDGHWASVGVTPPGGHGDRNVIVVAMLLEGGAPIAVCD